MILQFHSWGHNNLRDASVILMWRLSIVVKNTKLYLSLLKYSSLITELLAVCSTCLHSTVWHHEQGTKYSLKLLKNKDFFLLNE